jgi:hypothetical protein
VLPFEKTKPRSFKTSSMDSLKGSLAKLGSSLGGSKSRSGKDELNGALGLANSDHSQLATVAERSKEESDGNAEAVSNPARHSLKHAFEDQVNPHPPKQHTLNPLVSFTQTTTATIGTKTTKLTSSSSSSSSSLSTTRTTRTRTTTTTTTMTRPLKTLVCVHSILRRACLVIWGMS